MYSLDAIEDTNILKCRKYKSGFFYFPIKIKMSHTMTTLPGKKSKLFF